MASHKSLSLFVKTINAKWFVLNVRRDKTTPTDRVNFFQFSFYSIPKLLSIVFSNGFSWNFAALHVKETIVPQWCRRIKTFLLNINFNIRMLSRCQFFFKALKLSIVGIYKRTLHNPKKWIVSVILLVRYTLTLYLFYRNRASITSPQYYTETYKE